MILPFRITLILFAFIFANQFGGTMERFVLDVVRFFISIDDSNALLFNLVHLIVLLFPLGLFGLMVSFSLTDDQALKARFAAAVGGIATGLICFRLYQIWWVFRGGVLSGNEEVQSWTESLTVTEFYFWEKLLPYILVGITSCLLSALRERGKETVLYASVASLSSFLWLLTTHKIQNLNGISQISLAFLLTGICGFLTGVLIKKIKEF